jgi:hypothetical protein
LQPKPITFSLKPHSPQSVVCLNILQSKLNQIPTCNYIPQILVISSENFTLNIVLWFLLSIACSNKNSGKFPPKITHLKIRTKNAADIRLLLVKERCSLQYFKTKKFAAMQTKTRN